MIHTRCHRTRHRAVKAAALAAAIALGVPVTAGSRSPVTRAGPFGPRAVVALAWSEDGRELATAATGDAAVRVRDGASGRIRRTLAIAGLYPYALHGSGRSFRLLAYHSQQRAYRVIDLATGRARSRPIPAMGPDLHVAWNPRAGRVAVESIGDGTLAAWDVVRGRRLWSLASDRRSAVAGLAWSPDGSLLAVTDVAGGVVLLDGDGGFVVRQLQLPVPDEQGRAWRPVRWSEDGCLLAAAGPPGSLTDLRVWSAASGRLHFVSPLFLAPEALALAWHPRGDAIAYRSHAHLPLYAWRLAGGNRIAITRSGDGAALSLAWSPDGQRLAVGYWDGRVRIHSAPATAGAACAPVPPSGSADVAVGAARVVGLTPSARGASRAASRGRERSLAAGSR